MRIGISNIAWDVTEDESIASLLQHYNIDAIDIAPAKYFSEPAYVTVPEIARVREWWASRGIEIVGMQALLVGTRGLNLFADLTVQNSMLAHLDQVARIAAELGASKLVFGAPKNRDRGNYSSAQAHDIAVAFFRRLGEIGSRHGRVFCLEPNPSCYGANFMLDSVETATVVRAVGHPAIRMQFDTGAIAANGEDPHCVAAECSDIIGHFHISEPGLPALGSGLIDHRKMGAAMRQYFPACTASIEMLPAQEMSHLAAVEHALELAIVNYRATSELAGVRQ